MNKKKIIYPWLSIAIALLILGGCSDFLNESNPSNYNPNSFYKNGSQAEKSVNAIYSTFYNIYNIQGWMINLVKTGIVNTQFPTDAGFPSLIKAKKLGNISTHRDVESLWADYYQGIANANVAIAHIPDITMDATKKKQLIGQVHFLRALFYFNLVRLFGKVPLLKKPVPSVNSSNLNPSQASII